MTKEKFCQAHDDVCPCGKIGNQILSCPKPFTADRMAEILGEIETNVEIAKSERQRDDKANLN